MRSSLDKAVQINQRHPDVVKHAGAHSMSEPTMSFSGDEQVQFSVQLVETCKLKLGHFIHFYYLGDLWYFIVNDDCTGFPIRMGTNNCGRLNSKSFIKCFREKTGRQENCTFFVRPTRMQYKNCPVFEILTDKSRQELQAL